MWGRLDELSLAPLSRERPAHYRGFQPSNGEVWLALVLAVMRPAGQPQEMQVVFGVVRSPGSFTDGVSGHSPLYSPEGSTNSMSSDCRDT